jgi:tyrosyl-tRNA synthetase
MTNIDKQVQKIIRNTVDTIETAELHNRLKQKKQLVVKFGADPTAADLHFGHAVVLRKLREFQDFGHKVVFVIGDFTARIGDPSGRSELRPQLSENEINKNAETYQQQAFKILDAEKTEIVFNSSWLGCLTTEELMKLASHYTVARMLERDDFQLRLHKGDAISMQEFIYPLLQAYDSIYLKADVEVGGADQKFNLLVGRDIQHSYGQPGQIVITVPLLEGTDGIKKMSKSYGNYIGLTEPPDKMFGKIMSISDELMYRYYELLTGHDIETIKSISPMEAKLRLASELTNTYNGDEQGNVARQKFEEVFSQHKFPDDAPVIELTPAYFTIIELLTQNGIIDSKSEAKRLVKSGAVSIDGNKIASATEKVKLQKGVYFLRSGRRGFYRLVVKSGVSIK